MAAVKVELHSDEGRQRELCQQAVNWGEVTSAGGAERRARLPVSGGDSGCPQVVDEGQGQFRLALIGSTIAVSISALEESCPGQHIGWTLPCPAGPAR